MHVQLSEHFNSKEFDSPDEIYSGKQMNKYLIFKLQMIRYVLDKPIFILSGFRTTAHNASVGGVSDSSHLEGKGVDLLCISSSDRFIIISTALKLGFTRIGIYADSIHLDVSDSKPEPVMWSKFSV